MSSVKISELNEKTILEINDIVPIVDSTTNETKKITGANLLKNQYSTSEVKTNQKWINGKSIYRKVISVSDLIPSPGETKTISHGINNLDKIIDIKCIALNTYGLFFNFDNYTWNENNEDNALHVSIDSTNIYVVYSGLNYLGDIEEAHFILEYTKTTD